VWEVDTRMCIVVIGGVCGVDILPAGVTVHSGNGVVVDVVVNEWTWVG
jgi:hypothetical protein